MEGLSIDNILSSQEMDTLFLDSNQEIPEIDVGETEESEEEEETNEKNNTAKTEEDNSEESESVGSEDEDQEDTLPNDEGSSPNKNFYSSIASALRDEGIFPDLDDETLKNVKEPEDFRDLIEQQIQASLDDRQKRIDEALNYGIEPQEIKVYENTLQYLDTLNEDNITAEGDEGDELRKRLIYQDFINRGFSEKRAANEVEKSFKAGTDIEDAKEALESNKDFFESKYNNLIKEAKEDQIRQEKERKKESEALKKSILEDKEVFGSLEIDKATRRKILDNISKPVYKDPETGNLYTALQKYEKENHAEFMKKVGVLFTLTNGFKSLDALIKKDVRRQTKKSLRDLEKTLNSSSYNGSGGLNFVSGVQEEPKRNNQGWRLDI